MRNLEVYRLAGGLLIALTCAISTAWAGGVAIVATTLTDDGDADGYADTNETVELRLTVRNTSGQALTGVVATLFNRTRATICLTTPTVTIGDLAIDETRITDPFVFVVSDVDRSALGLGPFDDLAARFDVTITSAPVDQSAIPASLAFDLDLDVNGGSGATTFFESFEGSLSSFEIANLDEGLHGLTQDLTCYPTPLACEVECPICYVGESALHADSEFWGLSGPGFSPDGGRAFGGAHSLYFGIELGPTGWTTPLATIEAAQTTAPINIAWDAVSPELTFVHQASLADSRLFPDLIPDGDATDRAVVAAQLAGPNGEPIGPWIRLEPSINGYGSRATGELWSCMFDPIDDGSTFLDFPPYWETPIVAGPSTSCWPQPVYSHVGETALPFDSANVGGADGPGLPGASGLGTWVESRVDLSRFRGRQIRLRWLATTLKVADETWEEFFQSTASYPENPVPNDDGWWIDDVTVTGVLMVPAVLSVDDNDNSGLPGQPGDDLDGDGLHDVCDNCTATINAGQADIDSDGLGDLCDLCPEEPTPVDDADCDGTVDAGDNCPTAFNPQQDAFLRVAEGFEDVYAVSADGSRLVFVSRAAGGGNLYSVSTLGGNVVRLTDYPTGTGVSLNDTASAFVSPLGIDPTGTRVVYAARPGNGHAELFSVPIDGDAITKLNAPFDPWDWAPQCSHPPCATFAFSPDGRRVVFKVLESIEASTLFSVPTDGGAAIEIATAYRAPLFEISPDGATVVYKAEAASSSPFELYRVPIDGGISTRLNGDLVPGGQVATTLHSSLYPGFRISPDGQRVVYLAEQDTLGVLELFSVPLVGGPDVKLNALLAGSFDGSGREFVIAPDASRVVYLVDQETTDNDELYSVSISGGPATKLSGPLAPGGDVTTFAVSPDGATVVYLADADVDDAPELFSVPVLGGTPTKLSPPLVGGGAVTEFKISPDGATVAMIADAETAGKAELYVAPITGGSATKLNGPLSTFTDVIELRFAPDSPTIAYRAQGPTRDELYLVATSGGPATKISGTLTVNAGVLLQQTLTAGDFGIDTSFGFTPDGSTVVFPALQSTSGPNRDLYTRRIDPDPDGDGILFACDTCPGVFDPGQDDFDGDTAGDLCDCDASDPGAFAIPTEVEDVRFVGDTLHWSFAPGTSGPGTRYDVLRGDSSELPVGAGPFESCVAAGAAGFSYPDADDPAQNTGFFYLVRATNSCGSGTYGSGAEGERTSVACP